MSVQVIRSTDAGAPNYTATAGSLIALLDFALLNLPVPWIKTVLGANQAAYTQPAGTNGLTLQVDDTATNQARVTAWESLSAFNTGVNEFPSVNQMINTLGTPGDGLGGYVMKPSGLSNPTWRFFTNGKIFYFYTPWSSSTDYYTGFAFGDFISYKAGDAFNTVFAAVSTTSAPYKPFATVNANVTSSAYLGGSCMAAIARKYLQVGGSVLAGAISDTSRGNANQSGGGSFTNVPFPSLIDASLNIAPMWLIESFNGGSNGIRGLLPGIWFILHPAIFPEGYTFSASSGLLAGRSFEVVGASQSSFGQIMMETSNTWGGF